MKALVISPQPFFSPRGTPFSVYYRTLVTAQNGVQIDLLTYGIGQDVDLPGVRLVRIPRIPGCSAVKIGPSFKKLVLDGFLLIWTIGLLLRRRYDFVHAHEEAVFWARFLKPIFCFKMVYDMHSSLPQQLTNFEFTKSRLLIGLFTWLERTALRHSDAVITICPDLHEQALKMGANPDREFLIENSLFDPVRLRTNAAHPGSDTNAPIPTAQGPRIVYAGTFEPYQGVDILIRGFALARRSQPNLELVLVGGANEQIEKMRAVAAQCELDAACVFVGQTSRTQAARWLASADAVVSPRISGTNTPLKVYELLAGGRPIIATNIWSHTQVLTSEVCFLVDPTPESLATGISTVVADPRRATAIATEARRLYETKYSRAVYEKRMRDLLNLLRPSCAA